MKKIILIAFVAVSFSTKAQTKAMTEDGKEVVLLDNKTWKFVNESDEKTLETISTNDQTYEKAKEATFLMKSKRVEGGVYYNPKVWRIIKSDINFPAIEHVFTNSTNPNIFALFISENAPIQTLKNLKELVIAGVQKNATYFRLKEAEYRTINDIKVLHMKYSVNAKGIDLEYMGNYYLTGDGYCSITAYTFVNKYEENKKAMESFINGIANVEKSQVTEIIEVAPPPPMSSKKTK
ncbi:hypothetical protein [Chryseobacterium sp. SL1]|uniref:hypothetical protein n=1 Tax=Chryseobacterium sp. SL1 TaxID=2995159 RepID=UPI002272CA8B|nr:hypothetical protein [Chryseobacterium sp. SL1]MCY1660609.1 hypothetical protein [Chryseobacterium sp. SL1]